MNFSVDTASAGHYEFDAYDNYWTCDDNNNLDIYKMDGGECVATFAQGSWTRVIVDA